MVLTWIVVLICFVMIIMFDTMVFVYILLKKIVFDGSILHKKNTTLDFKKNTIIELNIYVIRIL